MLSLDMDIEDMVDMDMVVDMEAMDMVAMDMVAMDTMVKLSPTKTTKSSDELPTVYFFTDNKTSTEYS